MTRDFNRDLTIMVAGSGNVSTKNLEDSLGDWIFPNPETEREVHVILPIFKEMGAGIRNLIKIGLEWGFTFTIIQSKNAPMTRELSALEAECFVRKDEEREALEHGLFMLTDKHKAGDETAFILAYNPSSTYDQSNPNLSDYEILGEAKNYQWLQTLNLCESLVDSFEGFETTDEFLKRERLQKEFDDKQRELEAAKPKPVKKAPAPRKRAAKKVEPQESTEPLIVAEKPLEDVPVGTVVEVAGIEFTKKGPNPFREPLPADAVLSATVQIETTPDIQEDIREAHDKIEKRHDIVVSKIDLAQLSTDIKELTTAFGNIMDTFTRILKDG
jgi:hypothetical protein